ncbi:Homeodomain-interacting protein kinase 2 [Collichthys lucidus]|uniref:Homeodomain-interacting protein kinase 2 n=1 Tax=Collichthys lucidus TaxID=240159 RepID=A0A4U5UUV5_COLLU|nr:Homeodomain-interacting protein kinase 2 [Collichthys lucidus]
MKVFRYLDSALLGLKVVLSEQHNNDDKKREIYKIKMLEVLSVLDPVKKNVVQFFEMFEHKGHICLAFEMLDRSLLQLIEDRNFKSLSPREIRPIAQQLLTAFDALKGIGVVHADLKPDNIMLVNHQEQPFRVKLIDFGLAFRTSEEEERENIQPLGYRSPEVTLGLPISEAIDMWGLGCVLAFLYICNHLFSARSEYLMIRDIARIVGRPADHLLRAGTKTHRFFKMIEQSDNTTWRLKTPGNHQLDTGLAPRRCRLSIKSLDDLIQLYPDGGESIELEDKRTFVKLLKCLLDTDPKKRITPEEALKHPFITMAHLEAERVTSFYADRSFYKMLVCPVESSGEELSPDAEAGAEPSVKPGCFRFWKFNKLKL